MEAARGCEASAEAARVGWVGAGSLEPAARSPRRTAAEIERGCWQERERTGWGPRLIAGETGVAHSTVHAILRRHGCSRPPRRRARVLSLRVAVPGRSAAHGRQALPALPAPRARRHRRRAPDHADKIATRSATTTSTRSSTTTHGWPTASCSPTRRAATVTAFLERALAWFAAHDITIRRLMTDGAWGYTRNRALRELLASAASATSSPRPTRRAGTARSSASTRRWNANGPRACATATAPPETERCHTGCATTTSADPTAHSAANPRSAALTTSQGRTARSASGPGGRPCGPRNGRGRGEDPR